MHQVEGWHHRRLCTRILRGRGHRRPRLRPQERPGRPLTTAAASLFRFRPGRVRNAGRLVVSCVAQRGADCSFCVTVLPCKFGVPCLVRFAIVFYVWTEKFGAASWQLSCTICWSTISTACMVRLFVNKLCLPPFVCTESRCISESQFYCAHPCVAGLGLVKHHKCCASFVALTLLFALCRGDTGVLSRE